MFSITAASRGVPNRIVQGSAPVALQSRRNWLSLISLRLVNQCPIPPLREPQSLCYVRLGDPFVLHVLFEPDLPRFLHGRKRSEKFYTRRIAIYRRI